MDLFSFARLPARKDEKPYVKPRHAPLEIFCGACSGRGHLVKFDANGYPSEPLPCIACTGTGRLPETKDQ